MEKTERYRSDVHSIIESIETPVGGPKLRDRAKEIYTEFQDSAEMNLVFQFDEGLFARAALYLAAQDLSIPVSMGELGDPDDLGDYTRRVRKHVDVNPIPTPPSEYIDRFSDELDIDEPVRVEAKKLTEDYISSRRSNTVGVSAIYAASKIKGLQKTQKDLANHTGISEVSIRECYKDIWNETTT